MRYSPINNFIPETFAVLATMAGAALMFALRGHRQVQIGVVQIALFAFCGWILLGLRIHPPHHADTLVWPLASLLAAACAAAAGTAFRDQGALAVACRALATLSIAASLGTAAIQWYQVDHAGLQLWWLLPRPESMQPFGNVAQRNHAACVHALALLSYGLLLSQAALRRSCIVLAAGAAATFVGLVMTGSRIGTILGFGAVLASVDMILSARPVQAPRATYAKAMVLAVACYSGAYVAIQSILFSLPGMAAAHSAGTRWVTYSNLSRTTLFELAWDIVSHSPLVGIGWGNLSRNVLQRIEEIDHPQFANNTHNLVTQLAAETGVVGALLILPMLGWILWRAMRATGSGEVRFARMALVLLLVYSMTEFPLWNTYFLLPFAFAAGMFDKVLSRPKLSVMANISLALGAMAIAAAGWLAISRYIVLMQQVGTVMRPVQVAPEIRAYVMSTLRSPGFSSVTELLTFALLHADSDDLDAKIQLGERVVAQFIDAQLLLKQAVFLSLAGRVEPAASHLVAACRFYPLRCNHVYESIKLLAGHDAKTFGPVLQSFIEKAKADPRVPSFLPVDAAN